MLHGKCLQPQKPAWAAETRGTIHIGLHIIICSTGPFLSVPDSPRIESTNNLNDAHENAAAAKDESILQSDTAPTDVSPAVDGRASPGRANRGRKERSDVESAVLGVYRAGVALVAWGCIAQAVLTLFARTSWYVELACHFCMHSLVVLAVVTPVLLVVRMRRTLAFAIAAMTVLLFFTSPWKLYLAGEPEPAAEQSESLKVLSWNVLSINSEYDQVNAIIEREDADVLVLIEVRGGFLESLPATAAYSNRLVHPSWRGGGIAVLTKDSSDTLEYVDFGYPTQPAISLRLRRGDSTLRFLGMHTFSPMPVSRTPHRDKQLEEMARWVADQDEPTCVAGDLNITPWAPAFLPLLRSGLVDSRLGAGNCPSWPRQLGPLGIPIDHALCKGDCTITNRRVLPEGPGSDHLPIAMTVHF